MSGPASSRPRIGVLAVQGAVCEHEAALADVGARTTRVRLPDEIAGLGGLVIPGGESTTFGLVAERSGLLSALRRCVDEGMPVFGTCAGMIMLADGITGGGTQALVGGMDIVVRRNAFGRQQDSFEADLDIAVLGDPPMRGIFIRAPWIESAGASVEILAEHAGHAVAARDGSRIVAAFHPELTEDRRLHRLFVDMVRDHGRQIGGNDQEDTRVGAQ
ncbi:MAG: pyridoxal 5'-phosphate synthase glutaminase subunit PdxT [Thermoleophilia bacterium]|nr:pyridoxal 5'-phosphate synthase glutaminase subunit PdxT [Thermoleophilia bacterium]